MSTWAERLSGAHEHGVEHEWLGPDGARVRGEFGEGAVAWALDVGAAVAGKISKEIPQLAQGMSDFSVLRRATTSTTLRALTLVTGRAEAGATLVSTEVVEIAQDFARRGLELDDLLRSIRVGYAVLAGALLDAVIAGDHGDTDEMRRISIFLFEMMDNFSATATTAFLEEQRAWDAHFSAVRLDLVRRLIDGDQVEMTHATRLLNYPFDAEHVAIIASTGEPDGRARVDLRSVVDPVLQQWGSPAGRLIIPVGVRSIWAWGAFNDGAVRPDGAVMRSRNGVNIAVGSASAGVSGFCRTHRNAQAVDRLMASSGAVSASMAYDDVDLEVLLLSDMDAGRAFADRILGELGGTHSRAVELRHTLKLYFDHGHSLNAVAAEQHISRNTVTYRVQQAFNLCGHRSDNGTQRLHNALAIADWFDRVGSTTSRRPLARATED
jgi:PucR C-terminal helix-turn-helix domain/GGDEF-like domain